MTTCAPFCGGYKENCWVIISCYHLDNPWFFIVIPCHTLNSSGTVFHIYSLPPLGLEKILTTSHLLHIFWRKAKASQLCDSVWERMIFILQAHLLLPVTGILAPFVKGLYAIGWAWCITRIFRCRLDSDDGAPDWSQLFPRWIRKAFNKEIQRAHGLYG